MTQHHVEHVMGMAVSIELVDCDDRSVVDEIVAWLHEVDRVFSPYKEESTVTRIGRGELAPTDANVSDDVREVLQRCGELCAETDGAFDVWSLPAPNGTRFDPCGYVKGWSVQRAVDLLDRSGVRSFCINAGGDVATGGTRRDGQAWRIGVRDPKHADAVSMVIDVKGTLAVATSGCYERGSHIVDPRTGSHVAEFASATVIGPNLADADAYATVVYVMGIAGLQWLVDHTGYSGCLITRDRRVLSTDEFDAQLSSAGTVWRNPASRSRS